MHQLGFLLCESVCMCVSSGSKCVGVMSEENASKGRIARLSVVSETLCRLSGCFFEILLQSARVKQMRVKPWEIRLCKQLRASSACTPARVWKGLRAFFFLGTCLFRRETFDSRQL